MHIVLKNRLYKMKRQISVANLGIFKVKRITFSTKNLQILDGLSR